MLALRYIFGLGPRGGTSFRGDTSLETLDDTGLKDVVFLSLETTRASPVRRQDRRRPKRDKPRFPIVGRFQVGISVFDTRCLASSAASKEPMHDGLGTRHFCVLGDESSDSSAPLERLIEYGLVSQRMTRRELQIQREASANFLFGECEMLSWHQMRSVLEQLVADNRAVVLVVENSYTARTFLQDTGINLRPVYTFDMKRATRAVLGWGNRYSLEQLLQELSCPYKNLNTAGNAANFVLRALLMLVVRDSEALTLSDSHRQLLSSIQAVSQPLWCYSDIWSEPQIGDWVEVCASETEERKQTYEEEE